MSVYTYNFWLILEIVVLMIIFVPTMLAFLTGAPWVPTPNERVKKMLELAKIKRGDRIYDLGCGDGRIVHLAAKLYGADAVGIELSPIVYAMGRLRNFILRSKSKIWLRNFKKIDYSDAHALCFYLLPDILKVMKPKFEAELKPGALIVSYAFQIEGWTPVFIEPRNREKHWGPIYVYEAPTSMKAKGSEAKK
jgi:SAM-dependent methyltransferase